ncbi:hypothetical protein D9Q81_08760 [Candidatus Korarchaeum cryptofilum]|uniref:Uncharacterized protein n=1 Tax=Candidatus Korarchaeum cryptofilum TaxID=498846 RepID=A0A429G0K0_9CREN|nr:hypothetical protein [Candidatus Korarchaeum cryptofilum]RSN67308.1 hypothetical protein D9Q81_08760 [Candidatus Korarchaeum cryptofilum]
MRDLLLVSLLIVLLLPILHGAAQPDNTTRELPEGKEVDEGIDITELMRFWEEMKNVPGPSLTPEPNVYVTGRGYVTDGQGRFINRGINVTDLPMDPDRYYDINGNSFYVYKNDKLTFTNVAYSQFKGTYFSIFDRNNKCMNCNDKQTYSDYKYYKWIREQIAEKNYPGYFKVHVKYFVQAILTGSVYKNGNPNNKVNLTVRDNTGSLITAFEAELWSEENYCKGRNENMKCYREGWNNTRCGYPDDTDGGASRIRRNAISVSTGYGYYLYYPILASRSFGRQPDVITLRSRFHHQFALQGVLYKKG